MFDVYKLKNADQPFPRKLLGSFQTPNQICEKLGIDCETAFRMVCGETVDGMQIEKTTKFLTLTEPMTHEEIGKKLGIKVGATKMTFHRAIKKLHEKGVLHEMLEMIRDLRAIEEKPGGTYEIELSTKITVSE
jgi:predicted transcriptional regulator